MRSLLSDILYHKDAEYLLEWKYTAWPFFRRIEIESRIVLWYSTLLVPRYLYISCFPCSFSFHACVFTGDSSDSLNEAILWTNFKKATTFRRCDCFCLWKSHIFCCHKNEITVTFKYAQWIRCFVVGNLILKGVIGFSKIWNLCAVQIDSGIAADDQGLQLYGSWSRTAGVYEIYSEGCKQYPFSFHTRLVLPMLCTRSHIVYEIHFIFPDSMQFRYSFIHISFLLSIC